MLNFILLVLDVTDLDFALPTCAGMPKAVWKVVSFLMDRSILISYFLISGGFLTSLMFGGLVETTRSGRVDVGGAVSLLVRTTGIFIFTLYLKKIIFTVDYSMDELAIFFKDTTSLSNLDTATQKTEFKFLGGLLSIPRMLMSFTHILTVEGYIQFHNFCRSFIQVFLCIFAPIAAGISLFPSCSNWFRTWGKYYLVTSFHYLTLHVLNIINYSAISLSIGESDEPFSQGSFSIVMYFAITASPLLTSMFVSGIMAANLGGAIGQGMQSVGRSLIGAFRSLKP
jgi:hypothetical protein